MVIIIIIILLYLRVSNDNVTNSCLRPHNTITEVFVCTRFAKEFNFLGLIRSEGVLYLMKSVHGHNTFSSQLWFICFPDREFIMSIAMCCSRSTDNSIKIFSHLSQNSSVRLKDILKTLYYGSFSSDHKPCCPPLEVLSSDFSILRGLGIKS